MVWIILLGPTHTTKINQLRAPAARSVDIPIFCNDFKIYLNRNTIYPTCGHLMITLHGTRLHCENCGGQITEEDL